ncbi:ATP-dependent DNA ligase [Streptomyces sp. NPDC001970]
MSVHPFTGARDMLPLLAPMLAVVGPPPRPETEAEYSYETLFNGARVIAHLPADGTVRLLSRPGWTSPPSPPELQTLASLLPGPEAVLDGEIVAQDDVGRPLVERLQQRMSLHHPDAVTHAVKDCWATLKMPTGPALKVPRRGARPPRPHGDSLRRGGVRRAHGRRAAAHVP